MSREFVILSRFGSGRAMYNKEDEVPPLSDQEFLELIREKHIGIREIEENRVIPHEEIEKLSDEELLNLIQKVKEEIEARKKPPKKRRPIGTYIAISIPVVIFALLLYVRIITPPRVNPFLLNQYYKVHTLEDGTKVCDVYYKVENKGGPGSYRLDAEIKLAKPKPEDWKRTWKSINVPTEGEDIAEGYVRFPLESEDKVVSSSVKVFGD